MGNTDSYLKTPGWKSLGTRIEIFDAVDFARFGSYQTEPLIKRGSGKNKTASFKNETGDFICDYYWCSQLPFVFGVAFHDGFHGHAQSFFGSITNVGFVQLNIVFAVGKQGRVGGS